VPAYELEAGRLQATLPVDSHYRSGITILLWVLALTDDNGQYRGPLINVPLTVAGGGAGTVAGRRLQSPEHARDRARPVGQQRLCTSVSSNT